MTKSDLKVDLLKLKFDYWRNDEFNRDEFRGSFLFERDRKFFIASLDIQVDYYNVRIIWYYEKGKKVSKCYYVRKEFAGFKDLSEMLSTFLSYCIDFYKIDIDILKTE